MATYTCNNALAYNTALKLIEELKAAGLDASVVMGGIWAKAEGEEQINKLYEISQPYGVLFRPGQKGRTQYRYK